MTELGVGPQSSLEDPQRELEGPQRELGGPWGEEGPKSLGDNDTTEEGRAGRVPDGDGRASKAIGRASEAAGISSGNREGLE